MTALWHKVGSNLTCSIEKCERRKLAIKHSCASALRQRQLEELQVLALDFHEALEPLGEWLSATERRLSSAEPMGTQTAKISQQIIKHKVASTDRDGGFIGRCLYCNC